MGFVGLENIKSISGGWNAAARYCDGCKSAAAAVFCRVDSAFLCLTCDTKIHSFTRHERVLLCEVCEQAPASVTCKADAASLCVTCDSDIHSANPLASRHERVPVESFFDDSVPVAAKLSPSLSTFGILGTSDLTTSVPVSVADDLGLCPWLLPNDFNEPVAKLELGGGNENMKSCNNDFMFSDFDRLIDFEYPFNNVGADSVVPVQTKTEPLPVTNNNLNDHCFDIDFCKSKLSAFTYPSQSITQSVSTSSLEYGVVPDNNNNNNSVSEISIPFNRSMTTSSTISNDQPSSMDREARVLRYREKRKNRKFEKTIRYASRKAYAESRPRIKGRFAKRTETENDDVFFNHVYASTAQYGVVPTF